jgi:feruloyl esterase
MQRLIKHNHWLYLLVIGSGITSTSNASAADCGSLVNARIDTVRVIAATFIQPDPSWLSPPNFTTGNQPVAVSVPFCRVQALIETEIEFEIWLPPLTAWNGRYLGLGNGGDAGFINYQDLARGVSRGFAAASTDTGHKRSDANWGLGHPERVDNFGHRAHHLLAATAKRIVASYYARPASRSYFMGCSGGGAQGLIEAQRYPDDYDGIMSGAGGVGMLPLSTRMLWTALAQEKDSALRLSDSQWQSVTGSALAACDGNDGVHDGVVENPSRCAFDPAILQCNAENNGAACLTPAQVQTVRSAYAPLRDTKEQQIDPGFPPGARYSPVARQINIAGTLFGDWTYQDPKWDVRTFSLERDVPAARQHLPFLEFKQPDLRVFQKRGGKLITYHGWLDPTVPPALSIQFYEQAARKLGRKASDTFRLFMAPGMEHCSRGPGPESFGQAFRGDAPSVDADHDLLTTLMAWVEADRAPNSIIAARLTDGKVDRTRPLCPYPQQAKYRGAGSNDDAANFVCAKP